MKKTLIKIFPILLILMVIGAAFVPHQANASFFDFIACAVSENCPMTAGNWVMNLFAEVGNVVMSVFGYFLSAMGVLLNISILLTLNIKALYEATPAIEQIWIVIRNISSLFIIFGLIFTSIMTILDIGKSSVKEFVGKIILAGLFINFSLFFTKVAIDTSNLVSMQFYRAIAPTSVNISFTKNNLPEILSGSLTSGGLSNIFMESLKIPTIYGQKNAITKDNNQNLFTIIVATSAGSMLMLLAALSFFAASIAFLLRLVILLLLMGFSPVFFVGMVFPKIQKDISGKWLDWLTKELLFMPVYLLFMYVALRFLSGQDGTGFLQTLNGSNPNTAGVLGFVGLLIQYTIAFVLINIPLLAAVKVGGVGAAWGDNAKKWAGGMLKKGAQGTADGAWRNTGGRVASRVAQSETMQRFAGSSFAGEQLRKSMLGVARGYDENLGRRTANREATYNSLNDSRARTNYSGRLTNSIFTRSGQISMATTGRADRVGAARILTRRQTEITAEINRLVTRERQLQAIIAGNPGNNIPPRNLTQVEQAELDAINGTPGNPGDLATENANLATIQGQIRQFQLNTGGSQVPGPVPPGRVGPPRPVVSGGSTPRQVNRRNY